MKRNATWQKPLKKLSPYPDYYHPDQVRMRAEIISITESAAEWKCEGFAKMVVDKGFGALGPPDRQGRARTWQSIGRSLFGDEMFNRHLKAAAQAKLAARQGSTLVR